jgi:hypothetical protein
MLKFPAASMPLEGATPVNAVAAKLTTALTGANNDVVFTAKTKGEYGNGITIEYIDPGEDHVLSVAVVGKAIAVTLGYATAAITSTAANIKTAIEAHEAANALVSVANAAANDGSGVVTAMEATPLADGVDGTVAKAGEVRFDSSYLYLATADNSPADQNWRRVSLGSAY